jgi:hypothetical protein
MDCMLTVTKYKLFMKFLVSVSIYFVSGGKLLPRRLWLENAHYYALENVRLGTLDEVFFFFSVDNL